MSDEEQKKKRYLELLKTKPWKYVDQFYGDLINKKPIYIGKVDINSSDWIQFSIDNYEFTKLENWEYDKNNRNNGATKDSVYIIKANNFVGRDRGNSFEVSFGTFGDTNEKLKELFGHDNIEKLGFEEKSTKIRLIIHTPGHGTPWHDDGDALLNKDIDPNKWAKYWFSAIDWVPGASVSNW